MISVRALESVQGLAQRLTRRGIGLESADGSALDVLVDSTVAIVNDEAEPVLDVVTTAEITSTTSGPLPCGHNLEFDAIVEAGIAAVNAELQVARNKVVPAQTELYEAAMKVLGDKSNRTLTAFDIIRDDLQDIFRDGNLIALVDEYYAKEQAPWEGTLVFGNRTGAEVVEMLSTGFSHTDQLIATWVATKGEDWFAQTWDDVFNINANSDTRPLRTKLVESRDTALAVFLIARYLKDHIPEETGMDLNSYQDAIHLIEVNAGSVLKANLALYVRAVAEQQLVLGIVEGTKVRVNGEVYDRWIDNGGDAEVLFGYAVANGREVSAGALTKRAEHYKKKWYEHSSLVQATEVQNRFNNLRTVLLQAFGRQLEEEARAEGVVEGVEGTIQELYTTFRNELAKMGDAELNDLHLAILKLLCKTRFSNTKAYFILTRIDFHCKQNPALQPREAATLATIEYVADWVVDQTKLVSIK